MGFLVNTKQKSFVSICLMQTQILKHKKIFHAKAEAVDGRDGWMQMCIPVLYNCNFL